MKLVTGALRSYDKDEVIPVHTAVRNKIKRKQFSPFYILYGTEAFLIDELKQLIVDQALEKDSLPFNLSQYDLEEIPVEVAVEDAETVPFMNEYRIVVMKNPVFLTGKNEKKKVTHNLEKLDRYIDHPSSRSIVIFEADYEKLDQRKKLVKKLKNAGEFLKFTSVDENNIYDLLKERAGRQGAEFTKDACGRLVQLTGPHLSHLIAEVDKMVLYVGDGGVIDRGIVDLLCTKTAESSSFALVDHVVQGKLDHAYVILHDLFKQNEEPVKVLALLARQFRIIYQVKVLKQLRYSQGGMAKRLKLHPYAVKVALGQEKHFEKAALLNILSAAADTDFQMKTGKMDKRIALELLLTKITRMKNSPS